MIDIGMELDHYENTIKVIMREMSHIPFTYFKLCTGSNMSIIENWKLVLDKFLVRLTN